AKWSERFKGISMEKAKNLLGANLSYDMSNVHIRKHTPNYEFPESYDLREVYPNCESWKEIRDQGSCGSCWAFGAAEVISDRICIVSKQKLQIKISASHLISCCTSCGNGCGGGIPYSAMTYFVEKGIPTGGLYGDKNTCQPYFFPPCEHKTSNEPCDSEYKSTPVCSNTCQEGYDKTINEDKWYGLHAYAVYNDEDSIKTEIYKIGSVEASFTVYEDFMVYHEGVYQHVTGEMLGTHAVKIIGWGVENGVNYWWCANSWNDNWGDKGFFKILRQNNHVGIESHIVAVIPNVPHDIEECE
ncbi:MAG: C1 family peptidase, partial [Mycoplasma sp.]